MLAVLVTVLTLAVKGLRDYVLPKVNEITKRKLLNVLLDVVRMSNFTTLYFFTIWVLIGKTTKPTLNHTKYMIFLILMLFIARKLIFWILFAFKNDEQARKVFEKVKPKIPE
jgi:type II secretory pathway component PulF